MNKLINLLNNSLLLVFIMYGLPDSGDGERRIRRRSQVNRNSNCVSILDSTSVCVVVWRQPRLRRIHLPGSWFQHHIVNEVRVVALPGRLRRSVCAFSHSAYKLISLILTTDEFTNHLHLNGCLHLRWPRAHPRPSASPTSSRSALRCSRWAVAPRRTCLRPLLKQQR